MWLENTVNSDKDPLALDEISMMNQTNRKFYDLTELWKIAEDIATLSQTFVLFENHMISSIKWNNLRVPTMLR